MHAIDLVESNGKVIRVQLSHVDLLFFDTALAEFQRYVEPFEAFEYEDEDGDRVLVRSDDDLPAFEQALLNGSNRIWPKRKRKGNSGELFCIVASDLHHIEKLGRGHFGTVYRSVHVPTDQEMAVKCLTIEDDAQRQIFISEIELMMSTCECEFVVRLLGATVDANTLFICLEYMDGGSLEHLGPLPPHIMPHICRSVCEGLLYLWGKNIIHRDVKPSNMLVNSVGEVKISDFGSSKQMDHSVARSFVGTNIYMAPERLHGAIYRKESDMWSLGVSLWQLALGRFPFVMDEDVLNRINAESITIEGVEEHGPEFKSLLSAILVHDASQRVSANDLPQAKYLQVNIDRNAIAQFVAPTLRG